MPPVLLPQIVPMIDSAKMMFALQALVPGLVIVKEHLAQLMVTARILNTVTVVSAPQEVVIGQAIVKVSHFLNIMLYNCSAQLLISC